jgi:CMP-N,N'-diacetyllegionaminic acid synthase
MKALFIIPARGGSKGLPGKNIKSLNGKPLIVYSIEAALQCKIKGDVIVSTDDEAISKIAAQNGASVPFMRPAAISTDTASGMDVIFHASDFMKGKGSEYDIVVLLQPTSPLRTHIDIENAFDLLEQKKAGAVVGVSKPDHHPLWSNVLPENKFMGDFMRPEVKGKQRQELPEYFQINGAIYIGKTSYIRKQNGFLGNETIAYVMPQERSVDIDTERDFAIAEYYLKKAKN